MPKAFDDCVKQGGKVVTKQMGKKNYAHMCFPKGGGASVMGEMHTYKKVLKSKNK